MSAATSSDRAVAAEAGRPAMAGNAAKLQAVRGMNDVLPDEARCGILR